MKQAKEFWIEEHTKIFESLDECRPENGAFICVIEKSAYDELKNKYNMLCLHQSEIMNTYRQAAEAKLAIAVGELELIAERNAPREFFDSEEWLKVEKAREALNKIKSLEVINE